MVDLHRHDEFSTFDGFGKAIELAVLAKELGHTSLGTSNHGNTNGLVQTYYACKDTGIKPILGVEGYFLPKYKPQSRGYHLCLFAKDVDGYRNLNTVQYEGEKQRYYNPIWDFKMLEKYSKGVICTSACIASFSSQCILKNDMRKARAYFEKMQEIYGEDFYIEIQPYSIDAEGTQEKINIGLIKLANKLGIKCILTSDSHYGRQEDFETYMKMHAIAKHSKMDIEATYKERYMPSEDELVKRFVKMHGQGKYAIDFKALRFAKEMIRNLEEIEQKVDADILGKLELELPKMEHVDSTELLERKIKQGLVKRGKYNKKYVDRCKTELDVIKMHKFEDYFLIVADYVKWAKENGITVGPGRGSVCNCEVAYALGITEVDSIFFNLDFRRFLRPDKTKIPDIDLDFETSRRGEVIEYLCKKYEGHAARICSYGLYRIDNLINDLAKICGLDVLDKDLSEGEKVARKSEIAAIKALVYKYSDGQDINMDRLLSSADTKKYNRKYDNILIHFSKLFKKVRYIGTHAAGVAITGGNLLQYTAIRVDAKGNVFTNYDLIDIEKINVIKFDILGLKTMESIGDLRKETMMVVNYDTVVTDKKIMQAFNKGECDGIFQFEKHTARDILVKINCDCFDDIVAASSMNRPGPLSLGMPDMYAENKYNIKEARASKYWDYTKDTYGTIVYQEQIMGICVNIGEMSWGTADRIIKMMKSTSQKAEEAAEQARLGKDLLNEFLTGALKKGFTKEEAKDVYIKMTDAYSFNKGHGVGYSLISVEEMFYKLYYPTEYWYVKMKYAKDDGELFKFRMKAVKSGVVVFLPHVNYTADYCLRMFEDENVIQEGLISIKGIGGIAAKVIEDERRKGGPFHSVDEFTERCKSRAVTSRVISILKEQGALEFDKGRYLQRIVKWNSSLLSRT